MVGTTESTAAEPTATRDGCFGRCSAGRPSTDTVVPSRVMELIGERPSGLNGRRAKATATGTGEAFSSSTTTAPPSGTPSPEATAQARWTSSPPGMRATVSTTGLSSTRRWRTPTARDGRCHVSSAPIHQSSDQPSGHGVTAPRGSTTAALGATDGAEQHPVAVGRALRRAGPRHHVGRGGVGLALPPPGEQLVVGHLGHRSDASGRAGQPNPYSSSRRRRPSSPR